MHIMAVGVGADVNEKELKAIAMNDTKSVFAVRGYKDLVRILSGVLVESCSESRFVLMFYLSIISRA